MKIEQIIHKLEEECQDLTRSLRNIDKCIDICHPDQKDDMWFSINSKLKRYDQNQSIITILEKIDVAKIAKL